MLKGMKYKHIILLISLSAVLTLQNAAFPQTRLSGMKFKAQLNSPIAGATYTEAVSGEALPRFADAQSLNFYLDRRCASDSLFTLDAHNISVQEFFDRAAQSLNWDAAYLPDGLVYVGPQDYAVKLRTLLQKQTDLARKLPKDAAAIWLKRQPLSWQEGQNPTEMLQNLLNEQGIQIFALDALPHDIWKAGNWPSMSLVNRVQLIVGQFGLSFKFDSTGKKIALVPLDLSKITLVRMYPDGGEAQKRIALWKQLLPNCDYIAKNGKIYVRGRLEDLERILPSGVIREEKSASQTAPSDPSSEKPQESLANQRFTLPKVSAPPILIARSICKNIKMNIEVNEQQLRAAGMAPERVIEFEIKDATIEQLFDSLGKKAGCKMETKGNTLIILPK